VCDALYLPNSIDGGIPQPADWADGGYVNVPRPVEGEVVRAARPRRWTTTSANPRCST